MERWAGRVALITGASAGIGAALAERLVQYGMKVVGCSRNVQAIEVSNNVMTVFPLDKPMLTSKPSKVRVWRSLWSVWKAKYKINL